MAITSDRKPAAINLDGPFPMRSPIDGEEVPYWSVCVTCEDGEPIGKVYNPMTYEGARSLAERMSKDRRLELVDESSPE